MWDLPDPGTELMSPALADSLPLSLQRSPAVCFRWVDYMLCEFYLNRASPVTWWTKSLPAMQEMQATLVRSLGQEDPLEEDVAIYSSILAWKNCMDRGAGRATVRGVTKTQTQLSTHDMLFKLAMRQPGLWNFFIHSFNKYFLSPHSMPGTARDLIQNGKQDKVPTLKVFTVGGGVDNKQKIKGFRSVQLSRSVVSDSLWPHELQHARPPCPSPIPRVYSNSCPSSRWCHPAISSSVAHFSSCLQSPPASGSFPMSQLFAWDGQSIGVSASAPVLPMNTQDWSPSGWTGWISLQSKGLSRVFSNTTVQVNTINWKKAPIYSPLSSIPVKWLPRTKKVLKSRDKENRK